MWVWVCGWVCGWVCVWVFVCVCVGGCVFFKLMKHAPLPMVILHAIGTQLDWCWYTIRLYFRGYSEQHHPMSAFTAFPLQSLCIVSYSLMGTGICISLFSSSKFTDFVKVTKDFRCSVISSSLLAGQFPDGWTFALSICLLVWSRVHWWFRSAFLKLFSSGGPLSLVGMFYGPPYSWNYQTH